jgi:hypothetical protein
VDGQDDRFAAPGAKPPQDVFGFFSGPAPQAPAQGQFGSAPAPAPVAAPVGAPVPGPTYGPPPGQPYGAPAQPFGAPAQPFGAPSTAYAPGYAPTSTGFGRKQIVAAVAAVIVAVGAGSFGWNMWQQHKNIGVPATLGGLAQDHDPAAEQAMAASLADLKKEDPGKKAIAMSYGDLRSNIVVLIAVRGHLASFQKDFEQGGATGTQQHIGHNTCAAAIVGFMCERTSGHLTEGVFAVSRTRTIAQVSSLLDEAWKKS